MSFTIGRLAQLANVNIDTIRFYGRQGLLIQPLAGY
ncbi:MAG: MerR family mercuric resistance operon transcriptional regulator [Psychromonas sp.]|jgi:MerR family mercuric resistance operon transcriptional regulator